MMRRAAVSDRGVARDHLPEGTAEATESCVRRRAAWPGCPASERLKLEVLPASVSCRRAAPEVYAEPRMRVCQTNVRVG